MHVIFLRGGVAKKVNLEENGTRTRPALARMLIKKDLATCLLLNKNKGQKVEEKDILKSLSDEIIQEMSVWNSSNPDATFLEIEIKARELASRLEARLIQGSAQLKETDKWSERGEKERPTCPHCHVPLISRGPRKRNLQGTRGRKIELERNYGTCPKCGAGFFPP